MIPRKKRKIITITLSVLIVLISVAILGIILYINTDIFKSNEELFIKYLLQNSKAVEILKYEDNLGIKNTLDTNKYSSGLIGTIEYTENIETSDENKNSPINDISIKINSNVDKINEYDYKDISIATDTEELIKLEYLNQDNTYAIRLNGIKQFVSKDSDENTLTFIENLDIDSLIKFTDEEKEEIIKKYIEILQQNVSKDKYYKQNKSQILINTQNIETNEYYIKLTIEEFNNLYIKILEQLIQEESILNKIDLIEEKVKEINQDYEQEQSFREIIIDYINKSIEKIKNNNIGNEEVRIVVYENEGNLVRTAIEKISSKIMIDFYNDSSMTIYYIQMDENTYEKNVRIEKNVKDKQSNLIIDFNEIQNEEEIKNIELNYQQATQDNEIFRNAEIRILNEKYEAIFNIEENIEIKQQFENQITLENDNIRFEDLSEEETELIKEVLNQNIQTQFTTLLEKVDLNEYVTMLQNLQIINSNNVEIPNETEKQTDIEIKRFNSQFEFFISANLTTDNIKDMLQVTKNNLSDMGVLLKTGEVQHLNTELLKNETEEKDNYIENIEEIILIIKQNSKNEDRQNELLEFLNQNNDFKYTVSLEYDDEGIVNVIRMKIQ